MAVDDITPAQLKAMQAVEKSTLARWWCILNVWKWPEDLPDAEDGLSIGSPYSRPRACMRWIEAVIGHDACLREWNSPDFRKSAYYRN